MNERIAEIEKECKEIQDFLEIEPSESTDELVARLTHINIYLARSGYLLAEAKKMQDKAIQSVYQNYMEALVKMPSNTAKQFITSYVADVNYIVVWLDRLNRSCVHQGDNIRTQISFAKEELKLVKSGY